MSLDYDAIDIGEVLEESERLASQGLNTDFLENFVKMPEKDGFVTVRLLPRAKGKKFYCATRTHRISNRNVHCPRELNNRDGNKRWEDLDPKSPCPICKYYSELWKQAEQKEGKEAEDLKNEARKIKPIERYYYNVIVRQQVNKNGELEKNVGPKILSVGKILHQKIIRAIVGDKDNDEKPLGDVSDPKVGRDFKIVKRMRGVGNSVYASYDDSKFLDPSPLGDKEQVEKWIANLHELSSLRSLKSHDDIKLQLKKYLGLIPQEDTNFDITEFQKPNLEQKINVEIAKVESAQESIVESSVDKSLVPDEFFDELKNIK
jgi:hypothetical protein